jgi:hypothetical protein
VRLGYKKKLGEYYKQHINLYSYKLLEKKNSSTIYIRFCFVHSNFISMYLEKLHSLTHDCHYPKGAQGCGMQRNTLHAELPLSRYT